MTYLEKYKSEYPDAPMMHDGLPKFCPGHYYKEYEYFTTPCEDDPEDENRCAKCWNKEVPELNKEDI